MPFSDARADHALEFMSECPLIKGASAKKGLKLGDVWLDFQTDGLRELFGRVDQRGRRQYRIAFFYWPKKTGKTTIASSVGLYGLFGDDEEGPEVYSIAKDRDQAARVFDVAAQMRRRVPELRALSRTIEHKKTLIYPGRSGFWKVLAADADGTHGIIPSFVIFDEIHAQKDRRMWAAVEESMRTMEREEPLIFVITHAGERPDGLWYELYEHARAIEAGDREDPKFFASVYGAEKDEDWTDPEVWRKANPALGSLVSEEEVAAACQRAKDIPTAERDFRLYQLNQPLDEAFAWMPMEKWDACPDPVKSDTLVGQPCFAALDLSSTTDLSCLDLIFMRPDGFYDERPWFFMPEDNIDALERRHRLPYRRWANEGLICATPGARVDYTFIRACLTGPGVLVAEEAAKAQAEGREFDAEEALWAAKSRLSESGLPVDGLGARYRIEEIAYDPWNASHISIQLEEHDGFPMVQHRQGYASMNAPTKEVEALVLSKKLRHSRHPLMRAQMAWLVVRRDAAGNIKPDRDKSRGPIDGPVSLIMGVGAAMLHRIEAEEAVDTGVRWLGAEGAS